MTVFYAIYFGTFVFSLVRMFLERRADVAAANRGGSR